MSRRRSRRPYHGAPVAYPVGGRKAMNPTPWAKQVIHERLNLLVSHG